MPGKAGFYMAKTGNAPGAVRSPSWGSTREIHRTPACRGATHVGNRHGVSSEFCWVHKKSSGRGSRLDVALFSMCRAIQPGLSLFWTL